ncbi:SH3 domain-containing protein [Rhizobium sp. S95]|uniref:SH3 domain-containing protein n=1 Tax=Ciceribacter sichuanensis TaxID=2949647 RepID=A0AAJ1C196_9HYPH|nr:MULTISPECIES: SH3 domain-containing protein [unclassified Ciceribacter]MCM2396625.1 SH3 domain-containing protein [Ciceribacter sp. S95]MCM2404346.1 SH3 domain-containing protein [Ciceribacter sp. S153]MCO5959882.1 SH3 domain-containing protein [Ciceribacter sp. S101]
MLKRLLMVLALLATGASAASAATVAIATGNVNLRAGPSTAYPVVTTVPVGARIVTHGCLPGYSWCDIAFSTFRGWVSARYIQIVYNGAPVVLSPTVATAVGVTVVAFNQAYWNTYYRAYPWYGSWGYYYRPYAVAPPPRITAHDRSLTCANGSCTGTRSTTGVYGGSTSQTRTCSGGECTATRNTVGPYGNSASRVRNCSANDRSCTVTRTGPRGGTMTGTRIFNR